MKILKNLILPIIAIIAFTFYLTYFPNTKISIVMYVMIVSFVFGSSIFSYYFIFSRIFPDKRNPETPPQFLPKEFIELTGAKQTTAFKLTAIFPLITIAFGFGICYYLPNEYREIQLKKNGIETNGIITNCWHSKTYASEMRDYEFKDKNNKIYSDFLLNDFLKKSDTIKILYSSERPEINKVLINQ